MDEDYLMIGNGTPIGVQQQQLFIFNQKNAGAGANTVTASIPSQAIGAGHPNHGVNNFPLMIPSSFKNDGASTQMQFIYQPFAFQNNNNSNSQAGGNTRPGMMNGASYIDNNHIGRSDEDVLKNPRDMIRELDHIATSRAQMPASTITTAAPSSSSTLPQAQASALSGQQTATPFPVLVVEKIIKESLIPTPPTEIVEIIKPEYMKYVENGNNVNFHQVFEQQQQQQQQQGNVDVSQMDPKNLSLVRYREKRLKRMFNRVRYSQRRQVSQARPRIKGRFVKTDGTGESASGGGTPVSLPLSSNNPPLDFGTPNSIYGAADPSIKSHHEVKEAEKEDMENDNDGENEDEDEQEDEMNHHDDTTPILQQQQQQGGMNPKKRKGSMFRFSSLLSKYSSHDNQPHVQQQHQQIQSNGVKPQKFSFFSSFSRSAHDENPNVSVKMEGDESNMPKTNSLGSAKKRKSWFPHFGFFSKSGPSNNN